MVPVVTGLALASVCALHPELEALAVLLRAARVGAAAAFYVSLDGLAINDHCFYRFEALFVVLEVLLQEVIALRQMVLVVEAVRTAAFVAAEASASKTVAVKLKTLRLFAVAGWLLGVFLHFFSFGNFDFCTIFKFKRD